MHIMNRSSIRIEAEKKIHCSILDMYKLVLPDNVVSGLRLLSLGLCLFFTIHISMKSIITAIPLLGKSQRDNLLISDVFTYPNTRSCFNCR